MLSGAAARPAQRPSFVPAGLVLLGLAVLCVAVYAERAVAPAALLLALAATLGVFYRSLARWEVVIGFLLVVVLFIPIKRYQFAANLPFDLEPYRIVIAGIVGLWVVALLVDPRVDLRRTSFEAPLLLLGFAVVASVAFNADTITGNELDQTVDVSGNVAKELLFLLSFYLVFFLIVNVIRSPDAIHAVLKTLVLGATTVACLALYERRSRYNFFDHLGGWIPGLEFEGGRVASRGGRLRVYGSAQHPIALAAMLVMVAPISLYLAYQTRRRLWHVATVLLVLAALATVSRTGMVMIATALVVFLVLRQSVFKGLVIALLPLLIVVHLVVPGAIGSFRQSFFPREGLVQDQTVYGGRLSSRRLDPQFEIIREKPAFGQGYGSRITSGRDANALILDDQWLGTAVETGLVGVAAWLWLFVRLARRAGGVAKRDLTEKGWLLAALTASIVSFAVGMLTFDAFSFIQSTFVLFVLLGLSASTLLSEEDWPPMSV
jgi:hypothetical protein